MVIGLSASSGCMDQSAYPPRSYCCINIVNTKDPSSTKFLLSDLSVQQQVQQQQVQQQQVQQQKVRQQKVQQTYEGREHKRPWEQEKAQKEEGGEGVVSAAVKRMSSVEMLHRQGEDPTTMSAQRRKIQRRSDDDHEVGEKHSH